MEIFFLEEELTIEELERKKWEALTENTMEGAFYALYLQHQISQTL